MDGRTGNCRALSRGPNGGGAILTKGARRRNDAAARSAAEDPTTGLCVRLRNNRPTGRGGIHVVQPCGPEDMRSGLCAESRPIPSPACSAHLPLRSARWRGVARPEPEVKNPKGDAVRWLHWAWSPGRGTQWSKCRRARARPGVDASSYTCAAAKGRPTNGCLGAEFRRPLPTGRINNADKATGSAFNANCGARVDLWRVRPRRDRSREENEPTGRPWTVPAFLRPNGGTKMVFLQPIPPVAPWAIRRLPTMALMRNSQAEGGENQRC